jgi:hypothetical protein
MEYDKLPDLKMTALAVLYQTRWESRKLNRRANFVVKEALATFASTLEDDDLGYFYDPASPKELCINPGVLCGKIANSNLPYDFSFYDGIEHLVEVLNAIDDEYNRIALIVTDCFDYYNHPGSLQQLQRLKDAKVFVYEIGYCGIVLRELCDKFSLNYVNLKDAADLSEALKDIGKSLTIIR